MKDLFEDKSIKPMLIGTEGEPFDSKDFIFELKLDGERCVAYLDKNETELSNKRNLRMKPKFPELSEIHKQVKKKCILDGELMINIDGKPNFYEVRRRSIMSNEFKIELASKQFPATFVAFDILYLEDKSVINLPLLERKKLLNKTVKENERLAVSRYIEEHGIEFYKLAEENDLEGIVGKRKDSLYFLDKRTKDWIKIKYLQDDDFIVCGYILKENNVTSLVLGQYDSTKNLMYKGHVTLGINRDDFGVIEKIRKRKTPPFKELPSGNEKAIWITLELVCTVKYMMKTSSGGMRQPVFKGLRGDKEPKDCVEKSK